MPTNHPNSVVTRGASRPSNTHHRALDIYVNDLRLLYGRSSFFYLGSAAVNNTTHRPRPSRPGGDDILNLQSTSFIPHHPWSHVPNTLLRLKRNLHANLQRRRTFLETPTRHHSVPHCRGAARSFMAQRLRNASTCVHPIPTRHPPLLRLHWGAWSIVPRAKR